MDSEKTIITRDDTIRETINDYKQKCKWYKQFTIEGRNKCDEALISLIRQIQIVPMVGFYK
ncbi:MAG: hypothetical protein Satyrvirus11_26 [Satyrvirus sp.]|uniref:Uncharacterized protein n=1 Tax=Satyrvirus sp. TaxID=2487771 RepID=A0A3G5AFI2_9VIRU|nr:MAG: hypothetical protein Satyrvirus11_26 [Satyrvirus sp.]